MKFTKTLQLIVKNKYPQMFTWRDLEGVCKTYNHRLDTARRLMERDNSPNIEKVFNDKKQIIGWIWKPDNPTPQKPFQPENQKSSFNF